MARENILAIEDDPDILELLKYNLTKEGYQVTAVSSGEEGLQISQSTVPDLILLDLILLGMDGLEVCRRLKFDAKTRQVPIIMLTAKGEETDMVTGLELGADDYVTKPFSNRILLARVRAVLRRRVKPSGSDSLLKIHELVIDPTRHQVSYQGEAVDLTAAEFRLLHLFARRPGWVLTRTKILEGIHGNDYPVTERAVDVMVTGLRKKLGPAAPYIETVRGVGYRFKE